MYFCNGTYSAVASDIKVFTDLLILATEPFLPMEVSNYDTTLRIKQFLKEFHIINIIIDKPK